MHPKNEQELEKRVVRAAENALYDQQYVSAIDVFRGMGLLTSSQVESWRKGRIDFLERVIQGNLKKLSMSMAIFRRWAREKGLKPSETRYVRRTRGGTLELRFSASGDPDIERNYRTHYVSPVLPEQKQQRLQEKLNSAPELVVFQIVRDSQCSECGTDLARDSLLLMDAAQPPLASVCGNSSSRAAPYHEELTSRSRAEQPLCLACARLDDLEYLPAGDAALTRRAAKYSGRKAVVVRFSRSRGRYERQGILVERAGLEKAEQECYEDADQRAAARESDAERRREKDRELVARMAHQILMLFPGCPPAEAAAIAQHTALRGSGRVGRTEAGRNLEAQALTNAVVAAIRHKHTEYDELLASGMDRITARQRVAGGVDDILESWQR